MVHCSIMRKTPQIMEKRRHPRNKGVRTLLLRNRHSKRIDSPHMLPPVGKIIKSRKTLLYLCKHLCQYFGFNRKSFHICDLILSCLSIFNYERSSIEKIWLRFYVCGEP